MKSWFSCRTVAPKIGEVLIYDEIGDFGKTAKDFARELKQLGPVDEIVVRINSGGGNVFDGLAIHNTLKQHRARVVVRVDGLAASIASVIAMAGDEIEIPESAWLMIHDPHAFVAGTETDMAKMSKVLRDIKGALVGIYARRTGLDEKEIEDLMAEETWMDGATAVARGFATHLIDAPAIAASINFSKFNRTPGAVFRAFNPSAEEFQMSDTSETKPAVDQQPEDVGRKDRRQLINELSAQQEKKIEEAPKPKEIKAEAPSRADIEREQRMIRDETKKQISDAYKSATLLGLTNEAATLLDQGIDPVEVPAMLIEISARREAKRAAVGNGVMPAGVATVGFSYENPQVVLGHMAEAITASVVPGYKVPDAAREYMNWRPMGFMRAALEMRGTDTRRMQPADIVNAAMTSSDFPSLLGTSANKIFLGAYDAAPGTYRMIASRRDVPNFQVQDLLRPGDYPTLQVVTEGGEITAGTMSEKKETGQLKTYARMIQLSRQMLVNDSLGAFGDLAAKAGVAAAQLENVTVWGILTSNSGLGPTLSDGVALFNAASHANYAASGAALASDKIAAGRAAMRIQKSLDGNALNIVPSILAVPAALETTAETVLNPLAIPTTTTGILTPSLRTLNLVVEPLLDAYDTDAWFLFASPALRSGAIVYGGLEGNTGPRVTVDNPFNVDGVQIRVVHDFYAAVADYRYVYQARSN